MQQKKMEIGDYLVAVTATYSPDVRRWQPILRISRRRDAYGDLIHQDFNLLPAVCRSEAEAIQYGLAKGQFLVAGTVIGLTI